MEIEDINKNLSALGIDGINEVDPCPSRTAYLKAKEKANTKVNPAHAGNDEIEEEDEATKKKRTAKLKLLRQQYLTDFYQWFAHLNPYLLYEIGEDKTYWQYNEETGVYDEVNFATVRGMVIKLLIEEELDDSATETFVKHTLARFRAIYLNRSALYDSFDNEPYLFHAKNGWVDIRSLDFYPHSPDRLSRRVSAVDYNPDATCPNYDKFLDEQVQLQKDQIRVIDQFSGLLLTPDISKQKMLVLVGKPGCGKSTLLECWTDILGDLATQKSLGKISSESFARFGGSTLIGRRLCWFDEVQVTRSEMSSSLINLVSGHHIEVERKGINGLVEADNHLKCVLTANTLPRSAEIGIYRRMILIYMEYSFYDNMSANPDMRDIFMAEASGILNRMLHGLADLNKNNGFTVIEGHDDLIEEYKSSSNTVAEFLDEYFVFDEEALQLSTKIILEAYKSFSNDRYSDSLTPQRFGMLMKSHGLRQFDKIYSKHDNNGKKVWCGLKLKKNYVINNNGWIREVEDENF